MQQKECYRDFPLSWVVLRAGLVIALISVSTTIWFLFHPLLGAAYLLLAAAVLYAVMRQGCARCDYYHNRCDTGFSVLARRLAPRRQRQDFNLGVKKTLPWLVFAFGSPYIGAVVRLLREPSVLDWGLAAALSMIAALLVITNAVWICHKCRMNDICALGRKVSGK